jgi:putative tricarboxylic transport membrane protein
MRKKMKLIVALSVLGLVVPLAGCSETGGNATEEDAASYPSEELDWTIAFGPGGGNDIMARTLVSIIQQYEMYPENIRLENREGGGGATGWGYLLNNSGSGYDISTTSGSFITTPMQADTGWTYEDFTPVGLFSSDDAIFTLNGDNPINTWEEWVDYAQGEKSVVVGGIGPLNVDFILHALLAEAGGYEIEYVPFNDEGQLNTALLSHALDASVNNTGSILGQFEAGAMKPLLYTGISRLDVLPDVPTGEELGITGLPSMPRGMILAPDAPKVAQDWWIATMKEVVATPEWKEYLDSNYLTENIAWGDDFFDQVKSTSDNFETVLSDVGAL